MEKCGGHTPWRWVFMVGYLSPWWIEEEARWGIFPLVEKIYDQHYLKKID